MTVAIPELLMLALAFVAGLLIGSSFGKWRSRVAIQRGIDQGRYTLNVSRSFRRAMAREQKLRKRGRG
jgi:hypothetical protein